MNSQQKLLDTLNFLFQTGVVLLVVVTPFLFWNLTTEFYETPKFLFTFALTGILLFIWALKSVIDGKVTITRTPLDIPFLLLLAAVIVSTFFAQARWDAILGDIPRVHGGLASFVLYILLYFVLVSNIKQASFAQKIISILLFVGLALSALSILNYAGIFILPLSFAQAFNFTPTGSSFSTNALLILLLPFLLLSILRDSKKDPLVAAEKEMLSGIPSMGSKSSMTNASVKAFFAMTITFFAATIVLTGSITTYIAAVVAVLLVVFVTPSNLLKKNLFYLLVPAIVATALALLSFVPINQENNPLYQRAQNYPREVTLPFTTAWKVSVSAFRDSPFWGTGPGSYLSNFTTYKPVDFNNNRFWNIRFDQSFNEYLQYLAILGGAGFIAFLLLTVVFSSHAFKSISSSEDNVSIALAISGILIFVLLALHTSTLLLMVLAMLIFSLFMTVHKNLTEELQIGIAATKKVDNQFLLRFDALPLILLVVVALVLVTSFYFGSRFALADYHHRQALTAISQNRALDGYRGLVNAEQLNPYVDLYRTDIALVNFALANAIAAAKGPSESSPSGSLTDQDKQNIQTFLSQAITEGRVAVTLNPNNPANWEVLGSIYRQISGVAQNALDFSLDSYGRAIQKDPLNPLLRLTTGGIFYSVKNYDMAIRFFSDAANLKQDYANAYYNLAIALRDKGDLRSAVAAAERTVSLVDPNSQDYQVATDLLAQLRDQAQNQNPQAQDGSSNNLSPASETNSALENESLPQVLDLPKPENIATPEAIQNEQAE